MYRFLYKLYFFKFNNKKLDDYYIRVLVRLFNHILPNYFNLTNTKVSNKLFDNKKNNSEGQFIVSLTTFPARIDKVWLTIESVLRQDTKPDKLLLWLYKGEFEGKNSLPGKLLAQEKRGLEIRFVEENLMPHKKYFYAMQEFPDAHVITIDDDIFYPQDLIQKLIYFHKKYSNNICSVVNRSIKTDNNKLLPYKFWNYLTENTGPRYDLLPIGVGSVLYPTKLLSREILNKETLKRFALRADDLWLKIMSLKNKTKVVGLGGEYVRMFVPIINNNNTKLMDENIGEGRNDKIFRELIEYYQIPISDLIE